MRCDSTPAHIKCYTNLDTFAKWKGYTLTVGNPGTGVALEYFKAVDTIIYDNGSFPSENIICNIKYQCLPEPKALGILSYNVLTLNKTAIMNAKNFVGYIYVTDDGDSNPWDTLPAYLSQLFESLTR